MFHARYLFYLILLHLIIATPQINLYYTDWVSKNENTNALRHDCLRLVVSSDLDKDYEIMTYCLSESPSKFHVENKDFFPKFTFDELSKQNITSQQLYLWSTPIDIIERYQFYLNQLTTAKNLSLATEVFYNCTIPRFGSMCQYELHYYNHDHSSFFDITRDFYRTYVYDPTNFTCYTHLKCNRGPHPACLDWREICDGQIDCLDGGLDEEYCWQLEINECEDDEFRCFNGQCIPQSFFQDSSRIFDCIDASDERFSSNHPKKECYKYSAPSLGCEDITCKRTSLTSSCIDTREFLLLEAMYSNKNNSVSNECWSAFKCLLPCTDAEYSSCDDCCQQDACLNIVESMCPDVLFFPNTPVLFGDIYFAYKKTDSQYWTNISTTRFYICYSKSDYDDLFTRISTMLFNNMKCIDFHSFLSQSTIWSSLEPVPYPLYFENVPKLYELLKRYHMSFNYSSVICNRSSMYPCVRSSKCISIHRLMDSVYDCPHMDDENITRIKESDLMKQFEKTHFKCEISNKYIHQSLVQNQYCDCENTEIGWCQDEELDINFITRNILFQHICDGFVDLLPIMIGERNETDETECQQWECDNIYTRCNRVWNCPNGADETGCISYSTLNCAVNYHYCISSHTKQFICVPIEKANDGNVDCLGATDEPTLCSSKTQTKYVLTLDNFYCMNHNSQSCISNEYLCDSHKHCEYGDDEQLCDSNGISYMDSDGCRKMDFMFSDVEEFLCTYRVTIRSWKMIYFILDKITRLIQYPAKNKTNAAVSSLSTIRIFDSHQPRCHRGLDIRVWLNNQTKLTTNTCLCPPSYYGDQCQYQNQRISLSIQFRALSDSWQTLFTIVISLIDNSNERIIHSYEQVTFLSVRDCKTKFSMNLLYSTQPKDPNKQYAIHIDIYEKVSLVYRGSVLYPIPFPFLPVHRLAFIVHIPRSDDHTQSCTDEKCIHGKCIRYADNSENVHFCRCDEGWSGRYCTLPHTCTCSSDSLCIGVSASNRSICVCPIHKFGSRCLLFDMIRQTNNYSTCQNGGQRIPSDDYLMYKTKVVCICPRGFSGDLCELADNKLILSFEDSIMLPQQIFIHFIEITKESPRRATTFRTMPVKQDSLTIYWAQRFHLVFTELFNKNYYLTLVQGNYTPSVTIVKVINPSDRCHHINELFNETFMQWHLLRRIKYYHLACQSQSSNLSCFYDEVHLCLCYDYGSRRLANCFNFNHSMIFNCGGRSVCENDAQCLQDRPDCPTRSMCICPPCFYGTRCQFSTSGFGLSLDAILGYHILPDVDLTHQPFIVQMSLVLTIIFMVIGLMNGILSIITFKNKSVCEVGCGLYLLGSSITTLLTMTMFGLKFLILLLTQMTIKSNRSAVLFQCHSIDFLLRICLCMDQWLNACVAVERATTSIKGARFDKKKSKRAAKFFIISLLIIIISTSIHDPIYRQLIDEINDDDNIKRIWCVAMYSPGLEVYNYVMYTFHFSIPFLMNLISTIILIMSKSRQRAAIHPERNYREHLQEQVRQHKNLLTAPMVLIILGLPRVILTFASKCMRSTGDAWLFLMGYFISFIPCMLTFVMFIVPSNFYKKQFRSTIRQYRSSIQRFMYHFSEK